KMRRITIKASTKTSHGAMCFDNGLKKFLDKGNTPLTLQLLILALWGRDAQRRHFFALQGRDRWRDSEQPESESESQSVGAIDGYGPVSALSGNLHRFGLVAKVESLQEIIAVMNKPPRTCRVTIGAKRFLSCAMLTLWDGSKRKRRRRL